LVHNKDGHSRKIGSWCLWKNLSTMGCLNVLNQALEKLTKGDTEGLIHHSDREGHPFFVPSLKNES
jgi:hypothetical protein